MQDNHCFLSSLKFQDTVSTLLLHVLPLCFMGGELKICLLNLNFEYYTSFHKRVSVVFFYSNCCKHFKLIPFCRGMAQTEDTVYASIVHEQRAVTGISSKQRQESENAFQSHEQSRASYSLLMQHSALMSFCLSTPFHFLIHFVSAHSSLFFLYKCDSHFSSVCETYSFSFLSFARCDRSWYDFVKQTFG